MLLWRDDRARSIHNYKGSQSIVFPRIDAWAFISFATQRTRHLNEAAFKRAGVYFPRPPTLYVANAEVEIHFSSCDHMATKGVTGTLNNLLLEGHLEASLLCHRRSSRWSWVYHAVHVDYVPRSQANPASNWGPAFICYTALNIPGV